jgi:uncharacterized protein with LGFP repeats/pimeloyl-ACP methyl ester carboxylesterase
MDNSTVGVTSALNPQQPLKIDEKQNLPTSPLVVNSVDSSAQGSGTALNYVVQETVDKWAGKTATNYIAPLDSATTASSAAKGSTVSLLNPSVANTLKYYAALPTVAVFAASELYNNIIPQGLTISGVKPSYDNSSNLSIDSGSILDIDGWKDLTKVDFWLTDSKGVRVELADATSFLAKDSHTATFSYTTSLKGIANGDYKLNAVAYDKFGSASNHLTHSMTIKPVNLAPQALIINGIKSSYTVNSVLSIDPSFVSDNNGWQDLSKVDFWLTNDLSQRIELADVNSFTVNSTNSANFSYTTSLSGIAVGNYKINAIAYDRSGTASNLFTQSLTINPAYTLGFDGTKINAAFINTFNQVNGTQILGKAIDNVRSITGGTVQNFERGSIFQSATGTFALQGTLNTSYNNLSAGDKLRLGMPTANETSAGGYLHQSFQNGELQLVQGVPVKWSNQTLISDRYNLLGGANALGKSIGIIRDLNGSAVQDYEKGSIFASGNKTIAVTGAIATYYRANSASLGLPVSEEITTTYGKFQDFSNGKTLINSAQFGTQVLEGSLGGYYRGLSEAQRNQLGAPYTGENDLGGGNWRQFFKGGTVEWKNDGTGEIKLTPFTIGFDGTVVNTAFTTEFNKVVGWDALGKATGNVRSINGGTVQDFEKGSIFKSGAGTFAVRGSIGIYYRANSAALLLPTSAEIATSYGWRQDFQGAVVTHSPQFGTHTIRGSLGGYYNGLTTAQKDQLGAATTEEAVGGDGNWQQFFKGGSVLWKNNGTGELKLTPFTVGFDGNSVNPTFTTEFNKVVGWDALGKPTGIVRSINGGTVQDFEKGSIFKSGAGTFAVRGSIGIYYRANSAALLLPTSAEIATSYGWRQDFQGAVVTHSPQFGTHTIRGSLGGYYNGLTTAQKDQLGAATTEEAVGGDGNWQQFFKGGSVLWKNNGTGELKLTPFTVGFDGNSVNPTFTTEFNKVVGWDALGKPTGIVRSINGGTVQDFEKGSIFKSGAGTFAVRGSIGVYYRANTGTLGLPTTEEIGTSYGWRQDFENGKTLIHSPQFGTQVLQGSLGGYYRGLSETQRNQLGAAYTSEKSLGGGNWRQFFAGGTVEWKNNGTGEVKLTPSFSIGLTGNTVNNSQIDKFNSVDGWNALGSPTSNVKTVSGGTVQDFQKGSIYQSAKGTFVLDGILLEMYRQQYSSSIGLPIGDKVSTVNGLRQDFENGILISTPTAQTFAIKDSIATYYRGLSVAQLQELGAPIGNARDSNGAVVQDFQNGSIYKTSTGTFSTRGEIGKYDVDRSMPGVPLGEAVTTSYGSRQDFSEGTVIYSAKAGIRLIEGNLGKYYQSLTEAEKTRLGFTYNNQWYYGTESTFRFFQGGVLEVKSNGSKQVRFTAGAIGFDGTNFNDKFIEKFMGTSAFEGLGDPTSNIYSANGVLRQDFQKGYITQNGSTMESLFWQTNLGLLGRDYLNTTGKASASLPVIYNFTVDKQTNTSAKLYGIQGDAKFSLFNSQNQLIANDTLNSGTRFIQSSLAPGTYTLKVTSDSVGDFTLSVTPIVTIVANNPPPQPTGGGVIVIDTRNNPPPQPSGGVITITSPGNSNSQQGGGIVIQGSVGDYYNRISSDERQRLGQAKANEVSLGNNIWKQDFQGGTIFHGPKGSYLLVGSLHSNYYNVLSDSDRQRLGMPIGNETSDGGWHQSFENGVLQLVGGEPVKWSGGSNNQATGVTVGFDGSSAHNTYINTFNRLGGSGAIGSATNNVHHWGNGYTQDFQGGAEGRGAIMKSDANDNSYWVGGSFWNAYLATGNGADGALGYPTSDRIGNRQNFQNGALISGSNGIFAVYGGIGGHYLNNEGGENGRLGAPTSGEQGIGNGKIVQHFQNGDILYGSGATSTLLTAGGAVNYKEFAGVVRSEVGIKLRQGPTTGYNYDRISPYNQVLQFDAWTTGESIPDPSRNNAPDNRWFHVVGTNNWVASAYIYGEPNNSINTPFVQQPTPTNTGEPPINGGSSPPSGTSRSFNSSFFREGNIFWLQGFAPASTSPSFTNLGNAKGNCTWYVNGRLQELGYSTATLNKLSGNAQDWDNQAIAAGITISSTPKVGSIAQWENGHVAVIERVNADGTILISESSYSSISGSALDYLYNTRTISASNPTRFIIVPLSGSSGNGLTPLLPPNGSSGNGLTLSPPPNGSPGNGLTLSPPPNGSSGNGLTPLLPTTSFVAGLTPNSYIGKDAGNRSVGFQLVQGSQKSADSLSSNRKTWIVMHGMDGKSGDSLELAKAIDNFRSDDQVLNIDWNEGAKSDTNVYIGASHIVATAKTIVDFIIEKGLANQINLVGHSLGALLSYEISKQLYERNSVKVSSIIALDPASTTLGGYTNVSQVNFSQYSQWSRGFYGSFLLGNEYKANTAKESFKMEFPFLSGDTDKHGYVRTAFTDMLNRANRLQIPGLERVSSLFDLTMPMSDDVSSRPWDNIDGFEGTIFFDKDSNGNFVPDKIVTNKNTVYEVDLGYKLIR